jgi:hypothetical protein
VEDSVDVQSISGPCIEQYNVSNNQPNKSQTNKCLQLVGAGLGTLTVIGACIQ